MKYVVISIKCRLLCVAKYIYMYKTLLSQQNWEDASEPGHKYGEEVRTERPTNGHLSAGIRVRAGRIRSRWSGSRRIAAAPTTAGTVRIGLLESWCAVRRFHIYGSTRRRDHRPYRVHINVLRSHWWRHPSTSNTANIHGLPVTRCSSNRFVVVDRAYAWAHRRIIIFGIVVLVTTSAACTTSMVFGLLCKVKWSVSFENFKSVYVRMLSHLGQTIPRHVHCRHFGADLRSLWAKIIDCP